MADENSTIFIQEDKNSLYLKNTKCSLVSKAVDYQERSVLSDLSINTLANIPRLVMSGGGGGTTPALPPPVPSAPLKSDHEANVEFAREFVVELVEKVPKREKDSVHVKPVLKEDLISLKSASESSFQTLSSTTETVSLPDLLQPESVYKKQTDTDTDTAEYESAGDTDPLSSPIGSLLLEDILNSFQEALDKKQLSEITTVHEENINDIVITSPSEASEPQSSQDLCVALAVTPDSPQTDTIPNQSVTQSESSPLSESYEDAKSFDNEIKSDLNNISDLCVQIDNLHLDSPSKLEKNCFEIPSDSESSDAHGDCKLSQKVISENVLNDVHITEEEAYAAEVVNKQFSNGDVIKSEQTEPTFNDKEVAACDVLLVPNPKTEVGIDLFNCTVPDTPEGIITVKEVVLDFKNVKNEDISVHTALVATIEDAVPADSSFVVENSKESSTFILTGDFETEKKVEYDTEAAVKETLGLGQDSAGEETVDIIGVKENLNLSTVHAFEKIDESKTFETQAENEPTEFGDKTAENLCLEVKNLNVEQPASNEPEYGSTVVSFNSEELHTPSVLHASDVVQLNPTEEVESLFNTVSEQKGISHLSTEVLESHPGNFTPPKCKAELKEELANESVVKIKKENSEKDCLASSASLDIPCKPIKSVQETTLQSVISLQSGAVPKVKHIKEQETAINEPPNDLSELIALCSRQQKDLELGDEKFVDGKEFFSAPSLNESDVSEPKSERSFIQPSDSSLLSYASEFDKSITEEAEKVLQDIINSSDFEGEELKAISGESSAVDLSSPLVMAEPQEKVASVTDETGVNPFVNKTGVKRSPPPSRKSPRQSQNQSPAASPRSKSRHSGSPARALSDTTRSISRDASPRSQSNSLEKAGIGEGSPKNSTINSEINHSEAGPDIAEDAPSGDVFKDPSAFEFLNSVGNSHRESDLRKESLYVKFDPLMEAVSKTDRSVPLPAAYEARSGNIQPEPQEVPSPVKEQYGDTPIKNPAISFIDKLISLSPSPLKSAESTPVKQAVVAPVRQIVETPTKQEAVTPSNLSDNRGNEHAEMLEELYLLRELLAKQDEHHKVEIANFRSQISELQTRLKESEERETKLNKKVTEKSQGQKQMSIIMEEYEKTISRLVAEKEQERHAHEIDKENIIKERDAAMGHLANIEIAFSDVHKKYERSKTVIEGFKKNEEVLRASLAEYEATIRKQEQKYEVLKSHAMAQLESANQELEAVRRSQQAETAKLKAMLKKAELKTSSLEEMLEQKVKENQELASICDELINKVGSSD